MFLSKAVNSSSEFNSAQALFQKTCFLDDINPYIFTSVIYVIEQSKFPALTLATPLTHLVDSRVSALILTLFSGGLKGL